MRLFGILRGPNRSVPLGKGGLSGSRRWEPMKTILLVDDDYVLVEFLTELLQDEGYRVVAASNGRDGLARLREEKPDLVITDCMMPIADGRELLRSMRTIAGFESIPTVMMSATTKAVALSSPSGPLEVSAFIRKPARWAKFLDTVLRLIGRSDAGTIPELPPESSSGHP
jgi:CheY-like chemotaxis protein